MENIASESPYFTVTEVIRDVSEVFCLTEKIILPAVSSTPKSPHQSAGQEKLNNLTSGLTEAPLILSVRV